MNGELKSVVAGVGWDFEVLSSILCHKFKVTDAALCWLGRYVLDHFDGQADIQYGVVVQLALLVESDERLQALHDYLE
jgi:hypothetical protein